MFFSKVFVSLISNPTNVLFSRDKHFSSFNNIDLRKGSLGLRSSILFSIEFKEDSGILEIFDNSLIERLFWILASFTNLPISKYWSYFLLSFCSSNIFFFIFWKINIENSHKFFSFTIQFIYLEDYLILITSKIII